MAKRTGWVADRLPADVKEFFRKEGAKGGKLGGKLSWEALTPAQRSERARKASLAAVKARQTKARKGRRAKAEGKDR